MDAVKAPRGRRTAEDVILDALIALVMSVFTLSVLYPFWSMLVDSFSTPDFARQMGVKFWPRPFTLQPYAQVFERPIVWLSYWNTIYRSVSGTVVSMVVCFAAAFAVSKRRMPFRGALTAFFLFTMFFGGGLIPTYLWFRQLGLINTRFVLILPHIAVAYYIVILRNFFMAMPPDLEESAHIDGASVYTILFRIVVPLSMPVIATVALWSMVFFWNEWFHAMLFAPKRGLTVLQMLLRRMLIENSTVTAMEIAGLQKDLIADQSLKAATMFVAIGPIILVYPFIQKYFVKGIMTGAIKG